MLRTLRKRLNDIRAQKFQNFSDFEPIIKKIRNDYGHVFPQFMENRDGSRYVYNFGVPELAPISLEKEHHGRDHIPSKFAKRAIQGIEDALTYIEAMLPDEPDTEKEKHNESPIADAEAASGALSEPEVPDRDSGG